ncbi:proton-coupled amino acid transporter-like protein pathetic [Anastrepha ludens]|uniref:proton-coupled amino acid transporter-like protein pathetic n=1 Tax=Anastrepha ludens TaxID=28586 RepID=UPI0023B1D4E3|nr:proton-coupled amino acid transporter-like protein pathetic [Anastrepha ludens]XP_053961908.1 proton-coupled amino acid transporter-like protein pathetic [Anastrepha ludens]XP_053961909.1 proton-coupled amino acid transporter-like protein pathetic [Anastrepha ludens]XP_053961910.1 proton-coupled amino acid transporter-like protein pathetic [Anastrepha ludens]
MADPTPSIPTSKEKSNSVFTLNDFNSRTNLTEKAQLSEEYIPAEHRDQVKGQSSNGALAHLLKSSLGSGILAMPMAFSNGGMLFSMIATLVVGFICTHCVHILVKTSQEICKESKVPALNFAETAEKVFENGPKRLRPFSKFAKQFVDMSLMATYFAAICVYIVFIGTSFHDVINYDTTLNWNVRIYIALTVIPCLLIGQIRNLKWLVPFSAMANIFIVVTFCIVLYYLFSEPFVFSDKPLVAKVTQIPLFFATVIFAMEGIGVVMPVENAMKKPQQFLGCPGVLNIAMIIVVTLYAAIGFLGYARYGSDVQASITLNLKEGEALADTAKLLMAVAILFTFGLQFFIPNEILWRHIKHKFNERHHNIIQILLRTGIILIAVGVSVAIPQLGPFISLVGAVFFSLLGIFVPSVCETVYLWPDRLGCCRWILYKNIVLSLCAILALIAGSTTSIMEIIAMYT